MTRIWLDVETENRLMDEVHQRQQRLRGRVRTITPDIGLLANAYGDAYPWMDADVVTPLLQMRVAPDSPQAQAVATLAAQQAAEDGQFDAPSEDVPDAWYEKLADTMFGWVKPAVRTGFTVLATPWEELQALITSIGEAAQMGEDGQQLVGLDDDLSLGEMVADLKNLPSDLARFWDNYTNKAARSGGILALGDLLQGKHVDLGSGWLPGGKIYEERERAKQRLSLDGQFLTPGRLVARTMVEPGSTAYQVTSGLGDAALMFWGDPANVALKAVSRGSQAVRTFKATGMLNGIRKTVDTQTAVNHYLTSPIGRRMVRFLAESDDVDDVWRAIGKADLGVAESLTRARTDTEVSRILSEVLGTVVRERPTASFVSRGIGGAVGLTTRGLDGLEYGRLFGGGAAVRRAASNSRFWAEMPGQVLNPNNLNHAAIQLDNWARNARLPEAVRKQVIGEVAQLADGDSVGLFRVTRRLMKHTESELVERWGLARSRAQKMTQMYERISDDLVAHAFDDMGRHVDVNAPFRLKTGGTITQDPKGAPMLISELVSDTIPLPPTARDIRRATASVLGMDSQALSKVYSSGLWKGAVDGLDNVMSKVWKPFQLLRGAYTFRVIAEEQMRMAGAGYDSLASSPLSAIAWSLAVDPKSRLGQKMADLARKVIDPRGARTATGDLWDDIVELKNALSRGNAGHAGFPGELLTGRFVKATRDDPDFFRGWTTELAHMGNDPVVRRLAGGLTDGDIASVTRAKANWQASGNFVDDVKEWWWSGSGKEFREKLGRVEGRSLLLTDREVADAYIDMIANRLRNSTGGNTDLVDLIATGRLEDINIRDFGHERKLAKLLEERYADAAPVAVKKPETVRVLRNQDSTWQRVVDMGFDTLMSKPTNWLSRSPTFRQMYWQRVEELIDTVPLNVAEEILVNAKKANLPESVLRRMAKKAGTAAAVDKTFDSLAQVDYLAKGFALEGTKKLLYDLNKRSQFFDMTRLIFPFGEAWKEIITAWTGILRKSPNVARRFQQGIHGARAASVLPGATPGLTMPAGLTPEQADQLSEQGFGRGFFHTDPTTGEEVFTYPAGWAGKLLSVLPGPLGEAGGLLANTDQQAGVRLVGRAAGLNIVSATVLPGFGPAIQIPASILIPNTPSFDDLREIMLPFGAAEGDDLIEQAIDAVTPAWFDKLRTAWQDPEKHRLFASTVADVQRALLARGEHDISTLEGQQRLYDAAVGAARSLFVIRGLAQMNVPTGPSFQWNTTDVRGNIVPVKLLSDEYRRLAQEEYGGDWEAAFTEWVNRFGVNNVLALIGKSHAVVERPVTETGDEWLRGNQDLERDFPTVIGYFAPEPATGEFDYNAYLRQFETKAREATTPAQQLELANDLLGRVQWEQVKALAALRPGPQTAVWMAQMREELARQYPGFDGWVSEMQQGKRPKIEHQIAELARAVQDPTLARTQVGQGVIKYLSALEGARAMVNLLPGNVKHYQQAKAAEPIRAWLRSVAQEIIREHPDFARVWNGVFERELADDDPTTLGGPSA